LAHEGYGLDSGDAFMGSDGYREIDSAAGGFEIQLHPGVEHCIYEFVVDGVFTFGQVEDLADSVQVVDLGYGFEIVEAIDDGTMEDGIESGFYFPMVRGGYHGLGFELF